MAKSPADLIQDTVKQCNEEEIKKEKDGQTVQTVETQSKVESHVCEISHTIMELTEEKIKPPPRSLVEEEVQSSNDQKQLRPEASLPDETLPEDRNIKPPPYNNRIDIDIDKEGDGNDVVKPETGSNVEQLGFCQTSIEPNKDAVACQLKRKNDLISSLFTSATTSGSTNMLGPKKGKIQKIEKKVYNCTLCQVTVHSEFTWFGHLNGKRHQCALKRLAKLNIDKQVSSDTENKSTLGTGLAAVKVKMDNEDNLAAKPTGDELLTDERIAKKMQVGHKEQLPASSLAEERWQHLIMTYGASSTADLSTSSTPALAASSLPALGESSTTASGASSMPASRPTQYGSLGEYFRSTLGTSKKPLTTFLGVQLESWPVGSSFSGQKLAFSGLGPAHSQSATLFGSSSQQTQSASGSIIFGSTPAHSASSVPATGSSSTPAPDTSRMPSPCDPGTSSALSIGASSMLSTDASSMPTFDITLGRRSSPIGDDTSTFGVQTTILTFGSSSGFGQQAGVGVRDTVSMLTPFMSTPEGIRSTVEQTAKFGTPPSAATSFCSSSLFAETSTPAASYSSFGSGAASGSKVLGTNLGSRLLGLLQSSTISFQSQSPLRQPTTASGFQQTTPAFVLANLLTASSAGFVGSTFSDSSSLMFPSNPSGSSQNNTTLSYLLEPTAPAQSSGALSDGNYGRTQLARIVDYRWQSEQSLADHNLFGPYQRHRVPFVYREHERERIREEVCRRIIEEEVRRELEMGVYYGLQYPNLGYQGTWLAEQFKRPRFSDGFHARRRGPRFRAPCKRFEGKQWSWVREVQHTVTERNEGEQMAKSPVALIEDKVEQCNKEEELNKDAEACQLKRKGGFIPAVSTRATTSSSTDVLCPTNAKKTKIDQTVYNCTLCQVTVGGEGHLLSHLNGNRHQTALEILAKLDINKQVNSGTQYKCTLNWTQL